MDTKFIYHILNVNKKNFLISEIKFPQKFYDSYFNINYFKKLITMYIKYKNISDQKFSFL